MEKTHKIIISSLIILFTIIVVNITFSYKNVVTADEETPVTPETNTTTNTVTPIIPMNETVSDGEGGVTVTKGELDKSGEEKIDSKTFPKGVGSDPEPDLPWGPPTPKRKNRNGWNNGNSGCSWSVGSKFTFNDLKTHGDLLCNHRGSPLRGDGAPHSYGDLSSTSGSTNDRSSIPKAELTKSKVTSSSGCSATPEQVYILLNATCGSGGSEYTPAQLAWWGVSNGLKKTAERFQSYMESIGYTSPSSKFQKGETDDKGKSLAGFYRVNYKPKWYFGEGKKSDKYLENPTVRYGGGKITVGDFAIDYVHDSDFAYIKHMYLEINDPKHPYLELGTDFTITSSEKDGLDKFGFPLPKKKFQIVIKNKYDATKITNIHVELCYTTCKGTYKEYETYAQQSEVSATSTGGGTWYNYTVTVFDKETQPFVGKIRVKIKSFTAVLNRYSKSTGQVEIKKVVVDDADSETELNIDKYYEFEIKVDGYAPEIVRVKANSSAFSKTYTWETTAPRFTVKEIGTSETKTGTLSDGRTILVEIQNKINPKIGKLSIEKKVLDEFDKEIDKPINLDDPIPANVSEELSKFNFNVTIKGKFRYFDGKEWRRI